MVLQNWTLSILSGIFLAFPFMANAEENLSTMRYVVCVDKMMLAGAGHFVRENNRKPHIDDLVSSAMSVCQQERQQAISSLQNQYRSLGWEARSGEVDDLINQVIVKDFYRTANIILRQIEVK